MRPIYLLVLSALMISACNKTTNIVPINSGLTTEFGYKPGSYWIYKDSVSGTVDSAYIVSNTTSSEQLGCVLMNGAPFYQTMSVSIQVADGNVTDTERWNIFLMENTFSMSLYNNTDMLDSRLSMQPFTYPFATGVSTNHPGCVLYPDSAYVPAVMPVVSENGKSFTNTTLLVHQNPASFDLPYYSCFYASPDAGFVKVVIDHPTDSVHRVLELQRYKLVR
jgi:hypothetical protein